MDSGRFYDNVEYATIESVMFCNAGVSQSGLAPVFDILQRLDSHTFLHL